jgi:glyoxylate reductase
VGFDNVDLAAAEARGIWVTNTPGVLTDATADLAFGLLLAAARRIPESERFLRAGRFDGWAPLLFRGADLFGATLGIVGLGRIGQAMARRARAFGMRIVYAGRRAVDAEVERALEARRVELDELLATSDFVSLHCPLTPETRHLIDAGALARMKKGAILINTARGPIVDEAALVDALRSGHLAGAGLDVFEREPAVHPGLLELENVVLTPHTGSATMGTRRRMAELVCENLERALAGEAPPHPVNRPMGTR